MGLLGGGFFTKAVASGMGQHAQCLPSQSVIAMLEFSAICEGLSVFGIGVVKISICLTLLRVVERARRGITLFLWSLLVVVATTHLALAMICFLHCIPLARLWNPEVKGSCMSTQTTVMAGYVGFAIDVVTDLLCAGVPILVIHRLQMSFRTKVALCVLMGLGVFTAGCAVGKAITLRGVFADDSTFGFTKPAIWAAVEQCVGIIIASVPALRPLFSNFLERSYSCFSIWRHLFQWNRKTIGSTPKYKSRQDQKVKMSSPHLALPESAIMKETLLPSYADSQGSLNDQIQATPIHEESLSGSVEVLDPEMGLREGRHGSVQERNFLTGWSYPDIRDRESAMISMPHFDV